MLSNIYLLHFNNYYNRIVKRYDTIEEYLALDNEHLDEEGKPKHEIVLERYTDINFIPNDGVETTQVVNWTGKHPDYFIVTESVQDGFDEEGNKKFKENIVSRWFVMATKRTTHGQFMLQLKRDVVADYKNEIMGTQSFIEKGNVPTIDDPAIYNSEDMGFNQIKKSQVKLPDATGCPWVVGYIPRDSFSYVVNEDGSTSTKKNTGAEGSDTQGYTTVSATYPLPNTPDITVKGGLEKWPYYKYLDSSNINKTKYNLCRFPATFSMYNYLVQFYGNFWQHLTYTAGTSISFANDALVEKIQYHSKKFADPVSKGMPYVSLDGDNGDTTKGWDECGHSYSITRLLYDLGGFSQRSGPTKTMEAVYKEVNKGNDITTDAYEEILSQNLDGKVLYDEETGRTYRINVSTESYEPCKISSKGNTIDILTVYDGHMKQTLWEPGVAFFKSLFLNYTYTNETISRYPLLKADPNMVKCLGGRTTGVRDGEVRYHSLFLNINNEDYTYNVSSGSLTSNGDALFAFMFFGTTNKYLNISLTQLSTNLHTDIPSSFKETDPRIHLTDSPYDMFCMPYEDGLELKEGTKTIVPSTSKFASLFMAQAIPIDPQAGSATVYDIQLVPYCPVANIICKADGTIDLQQTQHSIIYSGTGKTNPQSVVIWCDRSTFTNPINYSIPAESTILDKKVNNAVDVYRLNSPNWNGIFEFRPQKNNGVTGFTANCSYKPFSPYIHVSPNFDPDGLYGGNYQDPRGLICGGDFSTAQVTSAWADYQMNNKTYQQQFDREISHMETMNKIDLTEQRMHAATGAFQGAAAGGAAGFGPISKAVGAGVGLLASAAGGIADTEIMKQRQRENMDYTKDMYGYNMQNIQMIPQGLAKVSADNANNTLVPVLEKYSCSQKERDALLNKLKYNGMTIMRIGTFSDFMTPIEYDGELQDHVYIKGKIIRLDELEEDYNVAIAIQNEINMGVFI